MGEGFHCQPSPRRGVSWKAGTKTTPSRSTRQEHTRCFRYRHPSTKFVLLFAKPCRAGWLFGATRSLASSKPGRPFAPAVRAIRAPLLQAHPGRPAKDSKTDGPPRKGWLVPATGLKPALPPLPLARETPQALTKQKAVAGQGPRRRSRQGEATVATARQQTAAVTAAATTTKTPTPPPPVSSTCRRRRRETPTRRRPHGRVGTATLKHLSSRAAAAAGDRTGSGGAFLAWSSTLTPP